MKPFVQRCLSLLFVAATVLAAGVAQADPPSRVMRLALATGTVSFLPAGTDDWVRAPVNRPLVAGDRLWTDDGGRSELHIGGSVVRLDEHTSVTLLNVSDRMTQLQLTQGTLSVRSRQVNRDRPIEIATPNLAYRVVRPGSVRVDVDPGGEWTEITLRSGQGDVFGEGRAFVLNPGVTYRFSGTDLSEQERYALADADDFDRWGDQRDRRADRSVATRYVSPDVVGYEDLDEHGRWQVVAQYGPVWMPHSVPAGWAPYHDGHWAWIEPWGWTWIDDAPWGFAPTHYGRWARLDRGWAWVPPPRRVMPVYAPAVVQFVGGAGISASFSIGGISAVAWFPLAPFEIYRPTYAASPRYLQTVNTSNTVIRTTNITNIVNIINAPVTTTYVFANRQQGSIVAMPTSAFVQARPVAPAALPVSREVMQRLPMMPLARTAPVAPQAVSIAGAAPRAERRPPPAALQRPVIARAQPQAIVAPTLAATPPAGREPGAPAGRTPPAARAPATATAVPPAPEVRVVTARTATALPPAPIKPTGPDGAAARRATGRALAQVPAPAQAPAPAAAPAPAPAPAATPAPSPAPVPAPQRRDQVAAPAGPREVVPPGRAREVAPPSRVRSEQPADRPAEMPAPPRQAEVKPPPPRQAELKPPPRQPDVAPPERTREVVPPGRQIAAVPPARPDADKPPKAERPAAASAPPAARVPPAPPARPSAATPPPREARSPPPARETREEGRAERPPAARATPPQPREERAETPPGARRAPPAAAPRASPPAERGSDARRSAFERAPKPAREPAPG